MTSSKQRNFTYNCFLKDIKGSKCCVSKVRQYRSLRLYDGFGIEKHISGLVTDGCLWFGPPWLNSTGCFL